MDSYGLGVYRILPRLGLRLCKGQTAINVWLLWAGRRARRLLHALYQ